MYHRGKVMKRKSLVAGYFYPKKPDDLKKMIQSMVKDTKNRKKAICIISPHAGYQYSGPVAGAVYSSVKLPQRYIILGPSHSFTESKVAVMKSGIWETPLGDVEILEELAEMICNGSAVISEDSQAHIQEHSIEVQIPFLQYFHQNISIVPISISAYVSYEELVETGNAVAKAIQSYTEDVMIVASTDMSHYVSQEEAREKDFLAIDKILHLDPEGLHEIVIKENISMCGFQPTTASLIAAKALSARKAELIQYQTSGDVSGNTTEVVGYAGIRIL